MNSKLIRKQRRHQHIRKNMSGTTERPRLVVSRSAKHIYAQVINDLTSSTLASANDLKIEKGTPVEKAKQVGVLLAAAAKKAGVSKVAFDRGGYKYHGRVKSLAEAAREGGLEF